MYLVSQLVSWLYLWWTNLFSYGNIDAINLDTLNSFVFYSTSSINVSSDYRIRLPREVVELSFVKVIKIPLKMWRTCVGGMCCSCDWWKWNVQRESSVLSLYFLLSQFCCNREDILSPSAMYSGWRIRYTSLHYILSVKMLRLFDWTVCSLWTVTMSWSLSVSLEQSPSMVHISTGR